MVRRLLRRIGVTVAFGLGASLGWCTAIAMAFWAGKKIDADIRRHLETKPIKATED